MATSETMEIMDFLFFPEMSPRSYKPKMKQNSSTELLAYYVHKIYTKNGPQTPPDPKSRFLPVFP